MPSYAIGDIQGCYQTLLKLLEKINFNPDHDTLWFVGDLVNRGPQSLVLGNHDLHLMAVAYGVRTPGKNDTIIDILSAPDRDELIDWLRHQPLLHHDHDLHFTMVHAGILPSWDLTRAKKLAREVEAALQSDDLKIFLKNLFEKSEPHLWRDDLQGIDRLRCIVNIFTRMRFLKQDGALDIENTGSLANKTPGEEAWFNLYQNAGDEKIVFGHWAALKGETNHPSIFGVDTGCAWGNKLTAMRLQNLKTFSCESEIVAPPRTKMTH
jgi:bis(5'-nucleosyl)-tetraphosphatase (symmetrical)